MKINLIAALAALTAVIGSLVLGVYAVDTLAAAHTAKLHAEREKLHMELDHELFLLQVQQDDPWIVSTIQDRRDKLSALPAVELPETAR